MRIAPVKDVGQRIYDVASELFPICRSITGDGVRQTLAIIRREIPMLQIHEIPSGTPCFDWTVPLEWNIRGAWVIDPDGNKIIDFANSNLHVVGYSVPVDRKIELDELQEHLYSLPEMPDAVPYVTSYYKERWGFCLAHRDREKLKPGKYRVRIDSKLAPGHLTYADVIFPGDSSQEVLISTYVCHPSLANNEVSGPAVAAFLAKWIAAMPRRRYTYRFVFIPETIGSIFYLSRHLTHLKANVIAGFIVTCVGDDKSYSYLPSRSGDTLADRTVQHVLHHVAHDYRRFTFLHDRGSDERQYCAPGVDLPVTTFARTLFAQYPEYHTSKDDLSFISPKGLHGAFDALVHCIETVEADYVFRGTVTCEPQLSRRGLYPDLGQRSLAQYNWDIVNLLAYCDGKHSLLAVAEKLERPVWELSPIVDRLVAVGLLEKVPTLSSQARI